VRFDWAQSSKSQWFLRTSEDSYLTHNALVEQGTLPSTGLTTHNNYWNTVISNAYTFSPTGSAIWLSRQPVAPYPNAQLGSGLRVGFSFQFDSVDNFRIRDLRR
jgi:hypothetical protein